MTRSLIVGLVCLLSTATAANAAPPLFDVDVVAVLSKAGCNMGTCHGNQNGKGGFKLSLRGQDPMFDFQSIVAMHGGRRVNLLDPTDSLVLQKPATEVAHQGGQRIQRDGELYNIIRDWLVNGAEKPTAELRVEALSVSPVEAIRFAPDSTVQLTVEAEYSDGSRRDVSRLAVYEASNLNVSVGSAGLVSREANGESTIVVRYLDQQVPVQVAFLDQREDFEWNHAVPDNYIDEHIIAKLKKFRCNPAPRCDDHVFLRRVFLDSLGILPTAAEAQQFAADTSPRKRAAIVDSVLSRPEFADHWAMKWADLLRAEENVLDRKGVEVFHQWIRDSIAAGKPMNQFAAEVVSALGSTYENPPTNYFRALRKTNDRGEATARVFLGTRLQCAQCHNHPFDRWTQDDYYSWAALFARIDYKVIENKRADGLDKNQFVGEQIVQVKAEGDVKNPTTGKTMSPKFLGVAGQLKAELNDESNRLRQLATWLSGPENRQFARAQVNRLWFHLMGKGLVEPVDDFRVTNPASHPALLEQLTDEFIASNFDMRHILRQIMLSESYQFDSHIDSADELGRVEPRRLSAEQLLDAQSRALETAVEFNGHPLGLRAGQLPGVHKVRIRKQRPSAADRFLFAFGKPERLMTCECERSDSTTLTQAILLINGQCMDDILTAKSNLIGKLIDRKATIDESLQALYWSALSRPPSDEERHNAHSAIAASPNKRQGLEDVAWALLNAKEFVFRQ